MLQPTEVSLHHHVLRLVDIDLIAVYAEAEGSGELQGVQCFFQGFIL